MADTSSAVFSSEFCKKCMHFSVCKYAIEITKNDLAIESFNKDNFDSKRIKVVGVTYDCRNRKVIQA